jgi:hypothetical protein
MTAGEKAAYESGVTKTLAGQAFSNGSDVQLVSDYSVPKVANRLVTINAGTLQNVASPARPGHDRTVNPSRSFKSSYCLPNLNRRQRRK